MVENLHINIHDSETNVKTIKIESYYFDVNHL